MSEMRSNLEFISFVEWNDDLKNGSGSSEENQIRAIWWGSSEVQTHTNDLVRTSLKPYVNSGDEEDTWTCSTSDIKENKTPCKKIDKSTFILVGYNGLDI